MSRSVDLSWVAPRLDRQNGVIRYYIIEAYENDTGNTLTYQTLSDQTSFAVGNLHPFYTYSIRIQAVTVGSGPLSLTLTVNTLQDSECSLISITTGIISLYIIMTVTGRNQSLSLD